MTTGSFYVDAGVTDSSLKGEGEKERETERQRQRKPESWPWKLLAPWLQKDTHTGWAKTFPVLSPGKAGETEATTQILGLLHKLATKPGLR